MNVKKTNGFLLIDKPGGMSTFHSLRWLRKYFRKNRVGFAGTLDPDATGLLIVGIGKATKYLRFFEEMQKCYEFTAVPGITTDTYDISGTVLQKSDVPSLSDDELVAYLKLFTGACRQRPPVYSAIKINGKRACDRIRSGEQVVLNERTIHIDKFELLSNQSLEWKLRVYCSKGTYVRTLAHDLGKAIGCGATAKNIRRLSIGNFDVRKAHPADDTSNFEKLMPVKTAVAHLPNIILSTSSAEFFAHGRILKKIYHAQCLEETTLFRVENNKGDFLGIGSLDAHGSLYPKSVFLAPSCQVAD